MTGELNVSPCVDLHGGNAGRTDRTQDILSESTILQLFFLVLDELRGDFVHIRPILSKPRSCWTPVLFHHPSDEALWGELGDGINRKYSTLSGPGQHVKAVNNGRDNGLVAREEGTTPEVSV